MPVRPQLHGGQGAVAAPGALQGDQLRVSQVHIVGSCAYLCAPADPDAAAAAAATGPAACWVPVVEIAAVANGAAAPPALCISLLPAGATRRGSCCATTKSAPAPTARYAHPSSSMCPSSGSWSSTARQVGGLKLRLVSISAGGGVSRPAVPVSASLPDGAENCSMHYIAAHTSAPHLPSSAPSLPCLPPCS